MSSGALHAFAGYGIELEYMIVDRDRLSVLPVADRLLHSDDKSHEARRGLLGWSNELVLHVIEIKNLAPSSSLGTLPEAFQAEVRQVNRMLATDNAQLMPGAMHPWMDPKTETRIWPHDNEAIYRAYDRIFDCKSHGWANLQSMHINLPFANDEEFARLHAAIRLVLPILPALAASSPIAEGRGTGWADYRMRVYCDNALQFPSITGAIIPETMSGRSAYEQSILTPMYKAIAPHDPEGVLQEEWLNSRGAIARFDRNAIEIRVVDTQECPQADLAIAAAAVAAVKMLYHEETSMLTEQQEASTASLAAILQTCMRDADHALIEDTAYLRLIGYPHPRGTAREVWQLLIERLEADENLNDDQWQMPLNTILQHGSLARRILHALDGDLSMPHLRAVYGELCECLAEGRMFVHPD